MSSTLPAVGRIAPLHALTGARFVAAVAVVLNHYGVFMRLPGAVTQQGGAAVTFFFVLSGFILTYNYAGRLRADSGAGYFEFLRARFARVYPIHLVMLLLATPIALYGLAHQTAGPHVALEPGRLLASWTANLLLLQAYLVDGLSQNGWNAPAWSVSCEATFYLAFPLLLTLIRRLPSTRAILLAGVGVWLVSAFGAMTVSFAITHLLHRHAEAAELVVYRAPYLRIADFAAGCLAGLWFLRRGETPWPNRVSREVAGVAAVALALSVTSIPGLPRALTLSVMYVPPFVVLILALASGPTVLGRALSVRPLRALGEASYSLYLLHMLPLAVMFRVLPIGPTWVAPVVMAGCVLASLAVFRGVEDPCRRLLRSGRVSPKSAALSSGLSMGSPVAA